MLITKYVRRGSRSEKIFLAALLCLVAISVAATFNSKKAELHDGYRRYTVDLTTAVEGLTSKLSLLSNLGVFQERLVAGSRVRAENLLNRAIFNEENISNLFLVDNNNRIFATNTYNAGGLYVGDDKELKRTNWEYVAAFEKVTNKFGEFGYFRNKGLRIAYVSKVISKDDHKLGSLTAVLRYGDMIDTLKRKHGFPLQSKVYMVPSSTNLGQHFECNSIDSSLKDYQVCYRLTLWEEIIWAKWALLGTLVLALTVSTLLFAVFYLINQRFVAPRGYFNSLIQFVDKGDLKHIEAMPVPDGLESMKPKIQALIGAVSRSSSVDLARQVAHDIRSPLAALNIVMGAIGKLDEETRLLVRHSITRIQDIANNLLVMGQENSGNMKSLQKDNYLVSGLIDSLITEKRTQYRERIGVEIIHKQCPDSYGVFCHVVPSEFKRVLSNLINNSVEAIEDKGAVNVILEMEGAATAKISIRDTGRGLSDEFLKKIGSRGFTVKKDGFGLGLAHAFATIESWGGRIQFETELGKGTTVTIRLPLSMSPDWFVDELKLVEGSAAVILDDDSSIHQIWDKRLGGFFEKIEVVHLSIPDQLSAWVANNSAKNALFLVDYEIMGVSKTGLDLIQELGLGSRAILVTSRFEETEIRNKCSELGVKLIPKGLAGFIPVKLERAVNLGSIDAVLIDDEALVHNVWKIRAEQHGKKLACFTSGLEFMLVANEVSKSTPIYVDLNLKNESGYEVIPELKSLGFANVYLATGEETAHRNVLATDSLKRTGKDPPWV